MRAPKFGACAVTTKCLDNKICTFKILLSWRFPRKTAFWGNSPLDPHAQPPRKCNFYFMVVSQPLTNLRVSVIYLHPTLRSSWERLHWIRTTCSRARFGRPAPHCPFEDPVASPHCAHCVKWDLLLSVVGRCCRGALLDLTIKIEGER